MIRKLIITFACIAALTAASGVVAGWTWDESTTDTAKSVTKAV